MEEIKALFFISALKRWCFKEIVEQSGMSRERVNYYLGILLKEKFLIRVKPKGKMPYYTANRETEHFRSEKKFYGLNLLQKSGLFEHIRCLGKVKTAILFGSFSRGDWNKSSDIDIFVFGSADDFEQGKFESLLKHDIQLFYFEDPEEIKRRLDPRLIPNIAKGFYIKENIEPFKVEINA